LTGWGQTGTQALCLAGTKLAVRIIEYQAFEPDDIRPRQQAAKIPVMSQDLFRQDAYLPECSATVTAITPQGIVLDRTVFYPLGGGQAGDTWRAAAARWFPDQHH
jgi:hypothetical protein